MATSEKRTLNINAILVDNISKELTGIRKGLDKTSKTIENQNKRSVAAFKKLGKAIKVVAGAFAAFKTVSVVKNIAQATDQLGKLAIATGDTADQISVLSAAFEFAGGDASIFKTVLSSLLASQKGALAGTKEQANAFRALGFSMKELRDMTPAMMLEKMAEGLESIETATERTQLLAIMFPDQWRNVINLVEGGAATFRARLAEARAAGAAVTAQEVKAARIITDSFLRMKIAADNLGRAIMVALGPSMVAALRTIATLFLENKDKIIEVINAIGRGIVFLIDTLTDLFIQVLEFLEKWEVINLAVQQPASANLERITEQLLDLREAVEKIESRGGLVPPGLAAQLVEATKAYAEAEKVFRDNRQKFGEMGWGALSVVLKIHKRNIREWWAKIQREFEIVAMQTPIKVDIDPEGKKGAGKSAKKTAEELIPIDWGEVKRGFAEGFESLRKQVEEFDAELGKGLAKTVTGTFDAFSAGLAGIIDGTKSAKDAWKDFAKSTLALIAQLIAKMAALKIMEMIIPAEKGGVFPGVEHENVPTTQFARGGIARTPQLAVFGEGNRAEAFVPLPDNRSIPVTFTGEGGEQASQVNVNVYAWDSRDAARGLIENKSVLQSIFTQQADNQVGMRQTLQRAVR